MGCQPVFHLIISTGQFATVLPFQFTHWHWCSVLFAFLLVLLTLSDTVAASHSE